MRNTVLSLTVRYDPDRTDPESIAAAMDRLLEMAMSTPGILDDYGEVSVEEFLVGARGCWQCPVCGHRRMLDMGEIATVGVPYCSDCEVDRGNPEQEMELCESIDT